MTRGFGTDVQLTRTQTIMQGASHCDFRYVLKQSEKAPNDG
jgi:L-2-amino-thiazoline-4-carboxylic acid hydrolase-like protein